VEAEHTVWASSNGVLYETATNRAIWSPMGKTVVRILPPVERIAGGSSQNYIFGQNQNTSVGGVTTNGGSNYASVITLVDLPATLSRLENVVFSGATDLATIICRATTVPVNSQNSLNNVGGNIGWNTKVYVPASSVDTYKASTWVNNATGDNPDNQGNTITFKGFYAANFLPFYTLTVNGGTGESPLASDIAAETQTVTITAAAPEEGKVFDKWTVVSGGITIAEEESAIATFTMPAGDVEVTATYKDDTSSDIASQAIKEAPVAVRYYTIQGVEVTAPAENGLYIVKKFYASKKSDVSKVIYKK
jgi:hypothetical protein